MTMRMESFWGTLKNELVHHRRYATRAQARHEISSTSSASITVSGGTPRLANLSPVAFAQQCVCQQEAASGGNHGVHY